MKRVLGILLMLVFLFPQIGPAQAASAVNTAVSQKLMPAGPDGALEVTWTGKADDQGYIYLPVPPKKSVWSKTEVQGDMLSADKPAESTLEGLKVHRWQVNTLGSDVTLKVLYTLPKLYAQEEGEGDSEGGPTRRGDIETLKYSFENTLPNGIANYSFTAVLPQGHEVFRVVSPKKFTTSQKDGLTYISVNLKGKDGGFGLLPGKANVLEVEHVQAGKGVVPLWIFIGVISAVALYYRRPILKPKSGGK